MDIMHVKSLVDYREENYVHWSENDNDNDTR